MIAEAVFAELFDAYSRASVLRTASGLEVSGANRDDPLSQALHLPAFATYQWCVDTLWVVLTQARSRVARKSRPQTLQ